MSDFTLDEAGDILISDGDLTLVSGIESIALNLRQNLRFFAAEWFLDERKGIPIITEIGVKNPNLVIVQGVLVKAIINTTGVVELLEFNLNLSNPDRVLNVSFKVRTEFGELVIEEPIV